MRGVRDGKLRKIAGNFIISSYRLAHILFNASLKHLFSKDPITTDAT